MRIDKRGSFILSFARMFSIFFVFLVVGVTTLFSYYYSISQPEIFLSTHENTKNISLSKELSYVSFISGERIFLNIEGKDYDVLFSVVYLGASLNISGKNYLIKTGIVENILINNTKIYLGISQLRANNAVIIISLDSAKVREEIAEYVKKRETALTIILWLFIFVFFVMVVSVGGYLLRKKYK